MWVVRAPTGVLTEVWHVPNLFPGKGFARRSAWSYQIQLVDGWFKFRSLVLL